MVFKRLLGSLGVGGPTVDTVLDPGAACPAARLSGQVHLKGGDTGFDIEHITLELVARVEAEHEDGKAKASSSSTGSLSAAVSGSPRASSSASRSPWRCRGRHRSPSCTGSRWASSLGVRTELAVAGAKDKGDLDRSRWARCPSRRRSSRRSASSVSASSSADLEYGRIGGTGQRLPFYQEIELTPAPQYAHAVNEIEVTFLAHPGGMEVVLEADKRGGLFSGPRRAHPLHRRPRRGRAPGLEHRGRRLDAPARRAPRSYGPHSAYGSTAPTATPTALRGHTDTDTTSHHGGHRSGPGMGTRRRRRGGLAVGVVGGMVAAEVVDEVGDFFEGDEEEED